MNLDFLDYFWRVLLLGGAVSTLILAWMWAFSKVAANCLSRSQMKWAMNAHYLLLALLSAGQALMVAGVDRELASRCFAVFAASETSFTLTRLLAGLWLCGVALGLALEILKNRAAFRRASQFAPTDNTDVLRLADGVCRHMGLRHQVRILTSEEQFSPFAAGFFRHAIVFPEEYLGVAEAPALKAVLAHEMVHVRDHDSLWLLLETLLRRILFFQPLAHILSRDYTALVEGAADEGAVICGGVEPRVLLKTLMDLIAGFAPRPRAAAAEVPASRGFREMSARIQALSRTPRSNGFSRTVYLSFLSLSLAVTALLALSQGPAAEAIETKGREGGFMCRQIKHEKMIEAWLHREREPVMCK